MTLTVLLLQIVDVQIVRGGRREVVAIVNLSMLVLMGAVTYWTARGEVLRTEMAKAVVEVVQAAVNENTKEDMWARITGQTSQSETKIQNILLIKNWAYNISTKDSVDVTHRPREGVKL